MIFVLLVMPRERLLPLPNGQCLILSALVCPLWVARLRSSAVCLSKAVSELRCELTFVMRQVTLLSGVSDDLLPTPYLKALSSQRQFTIGDSRCLWRMRLLS